MSSKKACRQNEALETAVLSYLDTGSPEEKEAVVKAGEALVNYYAGIYSPAERMKICGRPATKVF
jgi:hypothetical protein